jgi:hypothetical protein
MPNTHTHTHAYKNITIDRWDMKSI